MVTCLFLIYVNARFILFFASQTAVGSAAAFTWRTLDSCEFGTDATGTCQSYITNRCAQLRQLVPPTAGGQAVCIYYRHIFHLCLITLLSLVSCLFVFLIDDLCFVA